MDKRKLINIKNRKFVNVKIEPLLYYTENQNIIRSMYIEEVVNGAKDKHKLLALAILMNSYQPLSSFVRMKEAKDIGDTINWDEIHLIIKDIKNKLPGTSISKKDRNAEIILAVDRGISYAAVGRKYGLTGARVSQIYGDFKSSNYKRYRKAKIKNE